MTVHVSTRDGIFCHTTARWPARSGDLRDVTCRRCLRELDSLIVELPDILRERAHHAAIEEAIDATGLRDVWTYLQQRPDGATTELVRGIFGSVARGLHEMGYAPNRLRNTG